MPAMTPIDTDRASLVFRLVDEYSPPTCGSTECTADPCQGDPVKKAVVLWDDGTGQREIARTGTEDADSLQWLASSAATFHKVQFIDEVTR